MSAKLPNYGNCGTCGASLAGKRCDAEFCDEQCRVKATKKRKRLALGGFVRGERVPCKSCSATFEPQDRRNVFCSDACHANWRKSQRQEASALSPRLASCQVCEEAFLPNSSMHRLCSEPCKAANRRNLRLTRRYGLSGPKFEALLQQQSGGCAVCGTVEPDGAWTVDHDHACCPSESSCGACIRGVLCFRCNTALGLLGDSVKTITRALRYVSEHR